MKSSTREKKSSKPVGTRVTRETVYNVPAEEKALDVLRFLGKTSQGMSPTGIADSLDRSKQELFRVLVRLQERAYLVRDNGQDSRLSTKKFENWLAA